MNSLEVKDNVIQLERELGIKGNSITVDLEDDILYLSGEVESWKLMVDFCHMAAKIPEVKSVVSHIKTPETKPEISIDLTPYKEMGVIKKADVVIIGGGVTGCGAARTLSQYDLKIVVVEKESDICEGTTKANNGMIHSGYDSKPGSLKALCCVEGNRMYSQWAKELGFHFNRTGSFVCGFNEEEMKTIQGLYENGMKNGVPAIEIIDGEKARKIEPNLSDGIIGALWTPSAGYVEPYEVALALAENAVDNGAEFLLDTKVLGILKKEGKVTGVVTDSGVIEAKVIINAAGLYADEIARMAGDEFYTIHPRRGTIAIFDKENKGKLHTFAGKAPSNYTKGGGPQETPEGTLLWGPSAKEVSDKEDLGVDRDDLDFIIDKGLELTKNISQDTLITYFSGNRAANFQEDFIIENSKKVEGFMHVAGIQSPGLASAPAIAKKVEGLLLEMLPDVKKKEDYNPIRVGKKPFRECSSEERRLLRRKSCGNSGKRIGNFSEGSDPERKGFRDTDRRDEML